MKCGSRSSFSCSPLKNWINLWDFSIILHLKWFKRKLIIWPLLGVDTMEIIRNLIPTFLFECKGKFHKFTTLFYQALNTMYLTSWTNTKHIYNVMKFRQLCHVAYLGKILTRNTWLHSFIQLVLLIGIENVGGTIYMWFSWMSVLKY